MADYTALLAGNPNVGKSTLFNALTGLHQHTGNWPGKTVEQARGSFEEAGEEVEIIDLPGTYSMQALSPEEEITRGVLRSAAANVTVIVADAACLARHLVLALQVRERTDRMVLCVNLLDEAERQGIAVDLAWLSERLGIPVVGTAASRGRGIDTLRETIVAAARLPQRKNTWEVRYTVELERALARLTPFVSRAEALDLLLGECKPSQQLEEPLHRAQEILQEAGLTGSALGDSVMTSLSRLAEELSRGAVSRTAPMQGRDWQKILDRWLNSGVTALVAMAGLLAIIFYITIRGANVPSALLSRGLMALVEPLRHLLSALGVPAWGQGALVDGVYVTAAWVVAVMLPPMAIFFPLFTLLEDAGYLPRVAFQLDRLFAWAGAHGRQSLTMCMGLGCNACGVTGCRIIASPRERLVAILTNSFVPCNGRFPTLLALLTLFFAPGRPAVAALGLVGALIVCVAMTLLVSRMLSGTVLRGKASAFSLELPPYRWPRVGQVLVRSLRDRTLFVLGRAVAVAAPAGLLLWVLSHIPCGEGSVVQWLAGCLEPLGQQMGLDGMILLAFVLGFPANEIVLPVLLMGYLSAGTLQDYSSLTELGTILTAHGWTMQTALCALTLCLFHFPCGTTCLTIRRETGSWRWTALAIVLPTVVGMILCMVLAHLVG